MYQRPPLVGALHVYAGGLGGGPAAYPLVRLDEVMVEHRDAEYQRVFAVYAAGRPESVRQLPVQALLRVGVAHLVLYVDVADMPTPGAPCRAVHLVERDTVLLQAVGNKQPGNLARRVPGRPQHGGGVELFLAGRRVPRQYEPGHQVHHGDDPRLPAADILVLLVAVPLVPQARGLERIDVPFDHPRIVFQDSGYGVRVNLDAKVRQRQQYGRHRGPRARQRQGHRDVDGRHAPVLKAQAVPEPPPVLVALVSLPVLVFAVVHSVALVILLLAVVAFQLPLLDHHALAGDALGRYQQLLYSGNVFAPAPPPARVERALTRGAIARKRDLVPLAVPALGCHVPPFPGQGPDLAVLLAYAEPAARDRLLRHHAFRGILAPHA